MNIRTAVQTVKDMLFPVFCLGCSREGVWVCEACRSSIDTTPVALCPVCHEVQPFGVSCEVCRHESALDCHLAATTYAHGLLVAKIIEALKYQFVTDTIPTIDILFEPIHQEYEALLNSIDSIVPVPLHSKRFAERGYNQSELIAARFAERLHIPVVPALRRVRYTKQQASLEQESRRENVAEAFALLDGVDVRHSTILLVDDVYTTGSTMQSAASSLRAAGASSVVGISIARG